MPTATRGEPRVHEAEAEALAAMAPVVAADSPIWRVAGFTQSTCVPAGTPASVIVMPWLSPPTSPSRSVVLPTAAAVETVCVAAKESVVAPIAAVRRHGQVKQGAVQAVGDPRVAHGELRQPSFRTGAPGHPPPRHSPAG